MDDNFDGMTNNPRTIREVTEEIYYHGLEVLPPIYGKGCFAMGELYSGDSYFWFAQIKTAYYGFLGSQTEAENVFAEVRRVAQIEHCQNCNSYAQGLSLYGALVVCPKCKKGLQGAEMAKRQISFFDDQPPLFNF